MVEKGGRVGLNELGRRGSMKEGQRMSRAMLRSLTCHYSAADLTRDLRPEGGTRSNLVPVDVTGDMNDIIYCWSANSCSLRLRSSASSRSSASTTSISRGNVRIAAMPVI